MSAGGCVFLCNARVSGDAAVQEIIRERSDDLSDGRGQHGERSDDGFAEENVCARCPRVRSGRRGGDCNQRKARHAEKESEGLSHGQP